MCGPSTRCVLLWLSLYPPLVWGVEQTVYVQDEGLRDRVAGGQGVLSFPGVATSAGCALRCNHRPPCASYMIHVDTRLCVTCPENCTGAGITFTNASGYRFYKIPAGVGEPFRCANPEMVAEEGLSMTKISVGPAGAWAITSEGVLYHRMGTARAPGSPGTAWMKREGPLLRDVDAGGRVSVKGAGPAYSMGGAFVAGAGLDGSGAWLLTGVSPSCPLGSQWIQVSAVSTLRLSASPGGSLWLLDANRDLYFRDQLGVWTFVTNETVHVDAGRAGVFAMDFYSLVHHRSGTYEDNDSMGTDWQHYTHGRSPVGLYSGHPVLIQRDLFDDLHIYSATSYVNDAVTYNLGAITLVDHADVFNGTIWVINYSGKAVYIHNDEWVTP